MRWRAQPSRADRFLGLHFFNPAHVLPLVEVIRNDFTSEPTIETALIFLARIKKRPVQCKDTPGFIVNHVARPFYGEALRLLGEGVADAATIDALMETLGFKMGPFRLIDLVGCDVNFARSRSPFIKRFFRTLNIVPIRFNSRWWKAGDSGARADSGFYSYE